MTVTLRHGDLSVAVLPEEIDYANARLIGAQCEYLVRHGCRTLILDASRARLLDSSAIGMLVRLLRITGEYRGCLRIAGLGTYYRSVFEVLGIDKVFSLFPTAQAAARGTVSPTDAHENAHEHGTIHRTETQQG